MPKTPIEYIVRPASKKPSTLAKQLKSKTKDATGEEKPKAKKPSRVRYASAPLWEASEMRTRIVDWMKARSWTPLPHQIALWDAFQEGESGLLQMPTGAGKTYAAFFGALPELGQGEDGLQFLYITPLRALTRDLEKSIQLPVEELKLPLLVETRTGDTKSALKAQQKNRLPHILLTTPESLALLLSYEDSSEQFRHLKGIVSTTPESLALLLSYEDSSEQFRHLKGIVIDEWHDLLGTKRGSLLELNLARLRALRPKLKTWALSATIHNAEEAARAVVGRDRPVRVISGDQKRKINIRTLLPDSADRLPWAGHLGLRMLPKVLAELSLKESSLLFTNTRSQAERWYEAIKLARPDWSEVIALHHGSIELKERERVEHGVKTGLIRFVVCTASLDLGVDFPEVDRVYQIGSPKQISRILQRAGRSAHAPGKTSELVFVPTHALELLEMVAARQAVANAEIEARNPIHKPLDVLAQHLVSTALGKGFEEEALYREVISAYSFQDLTREEWNWCLSFVESGSGTLKAYPQYCKVVREGEGIYRVKSEEIARRHRQNIGTIVSDASLQVKLGQGQSLGTIEEGFLVRLKPGESFLFAGRWLELVSIRELTAHVKIAKKPSGHVSVWSGSTLPWSPILASRIREIVGQIASKDLRLSQASEEMDALAPIIEAQDKISAWPLENETLVEMIDSVEGTHIFLYPFAGKFIHEGLGLLLTTRLNRLKPMSCIVAVNDYGLEIVCSKTLRADELDWQVLLSFENWTKDIEEGLNTGELDKRAFRSIARIAGLVLQNIPGAAKSTRQIQTSSSLLYDVFARFDPDNLLLKQARKEVFETLFDWQRLEESIRRVKDGRRRLRVLDMFSPLGFPLYLERTSVRLSSESLSDRMEQAKIEWQRSFQQKYQEKSSVSSDKKPSTGTRRKR